MDETAQLLLTLSGILLLGLFTATVAQRTPLPRITLLLLFGIIIGPEVFDIIPKIFSQRFELIAEMTLMMVGFLLGGKLTRKSLQETASEVLWISICAALLTAAIVAIGLIFIGVSIEIAIVLGTIASATAPAAVLDVVKESGINSRFSHILLSIVALDDIWALVLFGLGLAAVGSLHGDGAGFLTIVSYDIGVAVMLGLILGLPAAYLTGRIKKGNPMLSEALGIVFLCGGLAIWLEVSYLIASMVMGVVIANLARHHNYPFHAIEGTESLFMVLFFVLAGASLEVRSLEDMGLIGVVYILCRALGKYLGSRVGGELSQADQQTRSWMGPALLPQAGVAIGMALVAANQFPEYRQVVLSVVISSTVFFELIGPPITRLALQKSRA